MLFNTLEFIIFLVTVVFLYYIIPNNKVRKVFLLASSYYFYASWNMAFLSILLFETGLSYIVPKYFSTGDKTNKDKWLLSSTLVLLLLPLMCFKYLNFFLGT